jgi:hypothetical protein
MNRKRKRALTPIDESKYPALQDLRFLPWSVYEQYYKPLVIADMLKKGYSEADIEDDDLVRQEAHLLFPGRIFIKPRKRESKDEFTETSDGLLVGPMAAT